MRGLFAEPTPHPARAGWQKRQSRSTLSPRERVRLMPVGLLPSPAVFRPLRGCNNRGRRLRVSS